MRAPISFVLLLLLALPARAQEARAEEFPVATAIVPVVGSLFGATMVRWVTDVALINDTGSEVDVALELTSAPGSPAIMMTLGPGQVQRFRDIVGEAFGLPDALSPLRVTTGGRRSVTVKATVYALSGTEVSPPQPLAVYVGPSWAPIRILDGLSFSDDYRTNLGLVNFSERDADFVLALQRVPGRDVAVTRIRVPAGSISHTPIQSVFPLITNGNDFLVVAESGTPDTFVYASVIQSRTNAGKFVAARVGSR